MSSKKLRPIISLVLLGLALLVGSFYVASHRSLLRQLAHTPPLTSLKVLFLYIVMFGVLMLILSACIRLCSKQLVWRENALLNAYSLFINFFIPGQGGPAYRGAYLYKRHKLRIKHYIIVTLFYYAIYAIISIGLLFIGSRPWWQTGLAIVAVSGVSILVINRYSRGAKLDRHDLVFSPANVAYLVLATALQALVQIAIYSVELHAVNSHISLRQIITYTGAANLALFVALTPGAIGIRESFLIFTEQLHHISSANIVLANIIDRSVYLVFLLILLIIAVSLHIMGKLQYQNLSMSPAQDSEPSSRPSAGNSEETSSKPIKARS